MDFELTPEQSLLRQTVREALDSDAGKAGSRGGGGPQETAASGGAPDEELGFSRRRWRDLAELGALGLAFSEAEGGQGAGPVEVMVLAEELGRAGAHEPFVEAALLPGLLLARAGNEEQRTGVLPEIATGTRLLAFAHAEPGSGHWQRRPDTRAIPEEHGWVLAGLKNPVLAGHCADDFVVSATVPDGNVALFLVDAGAAGVRRTRYATVDRRYGAQLEFAAAPAEPLAGPHETADHQNAVGVIQWAFWCAQAAWCAEAVGALSHMLDTTCEYLRARKQFGTPLAKFQALTHRAADMYVSLELARSMSCYLTAALADEAATESIVARAALQIGRAIRHIAPEAVQLHGAIGVTAESAVARQLARMTVLDRLLGGNFDKLRILAEHIGDYELVELQPANTV